MSNYYNYWMDSIVIPIKFIYRQEIEYFIFLKNSLKAINTYKSL